jgi:hypothetical protein
VPRASAQHAQLPDVLPGGRDYWRDHPYVIDRCGSCSGWGTIAVELAGKKAKAKVWTTCRKCMGRGRRKGAPPLSEIEAA